VTLSRRIGLGLFGQGYLTPGSHPLGVIFLNETRLKSAYFAPLIGFLTFVVGKL